MPIFIIENTARVGNETIFPTYFVEAPDDFGDWVGRVLVEWLRQVDAKEGCALRVIGVSETVQWLVRGHGATSVRDFMKYAGIVDRAVLWGAEVDRPRYRAEQS